MNTFSPTPRVSSPSTETEVQEQLKWIDIELERSSGSERRALEKAREELLGLMRILDDDRTHG